MKHFHEINKVFWNFVHKYDTDDISIQKKFIHTFVVANNCFDIASTLGFNDTDTEFCYIMGICHDLGRFEQWKKYNTYDDSKFENHGDMGKEILLAQFTPEDLFITKEQYDLLAETIVYHVREYKGDNQTLLKYLPIIHSADAYSNVVNVAQGNHYIADYPNGYSQEMLDKIYNFEKVYSMPSNTKLDRIFKSLGNTFCLYFDYMRQEVITKNYLDHYYTTYEQHLIPEEKQILRDVIDYLKQNYK